jgi:hypothetical protein
MQHCAHSAHAQHSNNACTHAQTTRTTRSTHPLRGDGDAGDTGTPCVTLPLLVDVLMLVLDAVAGVDVLTAGIAVAERLSGGDVTRAVRECVSVRTGLHTQHTHV